MHFPGLFFYFDLKMLIMSTCGGCTYVVVVDPGFYNFYLCVVIYSVFIFSGNLTH